jgi:hypothetical protein
MGDHYQTLGIQRDANKADIKNAYFRLAHRYHPDHHNHTDAAGRAEAAARFRQVKRRLRGLLRLLPPRRLRLQPPSLLLLIFEWPQDLFVIVLFE